MARARFTGSKTAFTISCSSRRRSACSWFCRSCCSCSAARWRTCRGRSACCRSCFGSRSWGCSGSAWRASCARKRRTRCARCLLIDVSDSVPDEALADARKTLEAYAKAKGADDQLKLVTFAERPRLIDIYRDERIALPALKDLRHRSADGKKLTARQRYPRGVGALVRAISARILEARRAAQRRPGDRRRSAGRGEPRARLRRHAVRGAVSPRAAR